jgi:peptidyl-prolyl cis-trans isomerase C
MTAESGSVWVSGVEIPAQAIHSEMQYHPAPSAAEARCAATRALVVRQLLLEAATSLGIAEPDPPGTGDVRAETRDEALIRTVMAREVRTPEPDEAACRRYYESNLRRFRSEDLYEGAHILFVADPADAEATARAKERAEAVLARVLDRPQSFADMAREFSGCSSGNQGGNLGQIARGAAVPEFETFLFNLEEGQICPLPIKSRYGYHIARLDRRVDGRQLPFEMVKSRIAGYLAEQVWRRAVGQYIALLIGQADVRGIELRGATSLLVQ